MAGALKRCFKCLCEKPVEDFYKHALLGDGRLGKCKDCTKADVKRHRQENWEKVRAYDRLRASQPHRVAQAKEIHDRWRAMYPNRKAAQASLRRAVLSGVVKPQPCWVCGSKAEAHHPDYDRALDVVWLCPPHHRQTHALVANDPQMRKEA
jgi:hypothetical protein